MPLVSVVIALYNKKAYIRGCLQSVLNQTLHDIEVLVIDDGSTDGSVGIVKEITDSRLQLISQENSGPGIARNKGIERARSSLISFLDADDQWTPDFLEKAFIHLNTHHNCDLYLCGASWQPKGEVRLPFLTGEPMEKGNWEIPSNLSAKESFDVMNFFATGAVVIRTEIIKKYGGFFYKEKCTSGEDAYLWIQVMFNHVIYRVPETYLIVNTEGSELGIGRINLKPIPPALTHPDALFENCPEKYLPQLKSLLNLLAFYSFRREINQMHIRKALWLYRKFQGLKRYRSKDFPPIEVSFFYIPLKKVIRGAFSRISKVISN